MKKSFIAFIGAMLIVLSALNIGVFESQKTILTDATAAGGYDIWDFGPVMNPWTEQVCCYLVLTPDVGCDPFDPDWGCY